MQTLINLIINGVAVFVTGRIIPGVAISDFFTAIVVYVVLAVVNTFIKPILIILTLPVNIMTLGLFTFVLNALVILIVDAIVPGFKVDGFISALLFSLVLSIISSMLYMLTG
ncbi:phage holin family protein [Candidatus Roizmanbacteria bacterium]|nr:phage holin family protein [Candidatus Roizmanbacteria bacterium]